MKSWVSEAFRGIVANYLLSRQTRGAGRLRYRQRFDEAGADALAVWESRAAWPPCSFRCIECLACAGGKHLGNFSYRHSHIWRWFSTATYLDRVLSGKDDSVGR